MSEQNVTATTLKLSGGQSYDVLYTMWGMMRAEEEYGFDTSAVELDPKEAEKKMQGQTGTRRLRSMLETVWFGVLDRHSISLEELARQVRTMDDFKEVARVWAHLIRYQMAPLEEAQNKATKGTKKK